MCCEPKLKKTEELEAEIFDDIPRGVVSRYLKEQSAPQSRWVQVADILAHEAIHYDPKDPGGKILLGAIDEQLIGIDDNRHLVTMAGSRAGKSITAIANLFFYPGSVLCTDPKGELATLTAQRRADIGQEIYVLDPFEIVEGQAAKFRASFNPIAGLDRDNKTLIEDVLLITDAMVVASGEEKDPHWNESASHFIMGLILYVCTSPFFKEEERNLLSVRRLINQALSTEVVEDKKLFIVPRQVVKATAELKKQGYIDLAEAIEGAMVSFYDKGEDERGSVLSTARRHTQFLDFHSMRTVLAGNDFSLRDLKTAPHGVSVYLVLPATRMGLCNRWLRLFVNQLLDAMEKERNVPDVPVLVCLDEFPVLGFMQQLQDAAGQIASFGVRLWFIMQDWGQGKALYGDRFESFIANASILQAFGNVDVQTTEYLSKRLGQTFIEDPATTSAQPTDPLSGMSASVRQHYPLLTPDEIAKSFAREDPLKRQMILWAGYNPMILQRVIYFDQYDPVHSHIIAADQNK